MEKSSKKQLTQINDKIAKDLRRARILSGVTQKELAHALGITYQQVQKYENGKSRISAARLIQLSDILGTAFPAITESPETFDLDDITLKVCARLMSIENPAYKRQIKDAIYCLTAAP